MAQRADTFRATLESGRRGLGWVVTRVQFEPLVIGQWGHLIAQAGKIQGAFWSAKREAVSLRSR